MRILVSGGSGEFCKELQRNARKDQEIFAIKKEDMDVSKKIEIDRAIKKYSPDIFIHAGALTRPMRLHEENPSLSISSNIAGTCNVVISCIEHKLKLVYISTDYVYPGTLGDYDELSPLLPVNKYGWSKLGGECAVMLYENSLILRMAMTPFPFSHKLALSDCYKSSIYITDAAKICLRLLEENGVINVGGKSQSIYDFAKESNPKVGKISMSDITDVQVAKNSTVDTTKLKRILNND